MLSFMTLFCRLKLASTAKGCFFSQRHPTLSHTHFPAENYKIYLHIKKGHCAISFCYNLKSRKYNFSSYSRERNSCGKVQRKGRDEKEKKRGRKKPKPKETQTKPKLNHHTNFCKVNFYAFS